MLALLECFIAAHEKWHFWNILSISNPIKKKEFSALPKPDGPLAHLIPSSAIEAANSAVCELAN